MGLLDTSVLCEVKFNSPFISLSPFRFDRGEVPLDDINEENREIEKIDITVEESFPTEERIAAAMDSNNGADVQGGLKADGTEIKLENCVNETSAMDCLLNIHLCI